MRVVASQWWDRHLGMEQVDGFVERREWATGGTLDANTIKIMLDGCPESCTASMLEPFEGAFGERHGTGIQFVDDETLHQALVALDARGFQVHQHALGDRAIRSGARCRRSRPHGQRCERRPPPPRAHPAPASRRRATAAASRRGGEPPAVLEPARPRDRAARDPARRGARRAAVPDRRPRAQRRRDVLRQRLAGVHAEPVARAGGGGHPAGARRTRFRAARRVPAHRPRDRDERVRARFRLREPRRRRGRDRARAARRPRRARSQPVRPAARRDRRDAGGDDAGRRARRVRPRHRQLQLRAFS